MKYEEAAGGHYVSVRNPQFWKALSSVVHQKLDLLIFGNAANSIVLFFCSKIGEFGLNRCVYDWLFYSCLILKFNGLEPG